METKVDNITATLARMDRRADGHEQRIAKMETEMAARAPLSAEHNKTRDRLDKIEDWRIESEAQMRGAARMGAAMKSAVGAVGLILSVLGNQAL